MKYVGTNALAKVMALTKAAIAAKATKLARTATLSSDGWTGVGPYTQSVSVLGVTADNDVVVSPEAGSRSAFLAANCYCSAQASGVLTFSCEDVPSSALTVNILIIA